MSVYGKFLNSSDNLDEINKIIDKVYLNEKKNSVIDTVINKNSIYVVIYSSTEESNAVATGCLTNMNNIYSITNVTVLEEEQNNGYEELAVRMLVNKAFNIGASEIYIHIPLISVPFYSNIGFITIENEKSKEELKYITMKIDNDNFYNQCDKKRPKMSQKF